MSCARRENTAEPKSGRLTSSGGLLLTPVIRFVGVAHRSGQLHLRLRITPEGSGKCSFANSALSARVFNRSEASMLGKWHLVLGSLVIAAAISVSSAHAAQFGLANSGGNWTEQSRLVEKTHGWHHYCDRSPVRYHRHVPGLGNVPCEGDGYHRRHWYRYDDDRGRWRYREHRRWYGDHDDRGRWRHRDQSRCMIEPWLCRRGH